jgi:hypothetical protein
MQCGGVFGEMELRKHYEKPSERKVRERSEAIRLARKLARKKLQGCGLLLPAKPRLAAGVVGKSPSRPPASDLATTFAMQVARWNCTTHLPSAVTKMPR